MTVRFHVRNTKALREASQALVPGVHTTTAFWWFKGYWTFCTSQLKTPKSHAYQRGHNLFLNHQICTEHHLWVRYSPMDKKIQGSHAHRVRMYNGLASSFRGWHQLFTPVRWHWHLYFTFNKSFLWALEQESIFTFCHLEAREKTRGIHHTSRCYSTHLKIWTQRNLRITTRTS